VKTDPVDMVEALMQRVRVRRVPVLDKEGRLMGIVSMNDLARHAHRSIGRKADGLGGDSIVQTLAAVCEPRATQNAKARATDGVAQLTA
jgi:CBS-domain-containing membrane protein